MYSPQVSSTSSHARCPRPLSITCVSPLWGLDSSKELLQLLLGCGLDVVVERVAVGVDPDRQRAEVLHAELPQAFGHELLPGDLLDLLDLGRLERRRAADDREVDHPVAAHRLGRLVREAALAADRADAVALAERVGEPDLPDAGRGVQEEGAAQVHRGLLALVEDPDLRPVADPDDVALDDDLVAGAELQDLLGIGDGEGDLVRRHPQASRSKSTVPSALTCAVARRAAQHW